MSNTIVDDFGNLFDITTRQWVGRLDLDGREQVGLPGGPGGGVTPNAFQISQGAVAFTPDEDRGAVYMGGQHYNVRGDGDNITDALASVLAAGKVPLLPSGDYEITPGQIVSPNGRIWGVGQWRDGAPLTVGGPASKGVNLRAASTGTGYLIELTSQWDLRDLSFMDASRRIGLYAIGTQGAYGMGKPVGMNLRLDGFDIGANFGSSCEFPIGGYMIGTYGRNARQGVLVFGGKGTTPRSGEDGFTLINTHCTNLGCADLDIYFQGAPTSSPDATHDLIDWTATANAAGALVPLFGYAVYRAPVNGGPWTIVPDWVDSNYTQTSYTTKKVSGTTWFYCVMANTFGWSFARNKKIDIVTSHAEYFNMPQHYLGCRDAVVSTVYAETRNGDPASTSPNTRGGWAVIVSNSSSVTVNGKIYCESYGYGSATIYNGSLRLSGYDQGAGVKYGFNMEYGGSQQQLIVENQTGWDGTTPFNVSPRGNVNETRYFARWTKQDGTQGETRSTDVSYQWDNGFRLDPTQASGGPGTLFGQDKLTAAGLQRGMQMLDVRQPSKTAFKFPFTNVAGGSPATLPRTTLAVGSATPFMSFDAPTSVSWGFVVDVHVDVYDSASTARQSIESEIAVVGVMNSGLASPSVTVALRNQDWASPRDATPAPGVVFDASITGSTVTLRALATTAEHQTPVLVHAHVTAARGFRGTAELANLQLL